jgi:hypothetical protein
MQTFRYLLFFLCISVSTQTVDLERNSSVSPTVFYYWFLPTMPSPDVVAASTLFVMALSERTDALSIQRDRYERVAQIQKSIQRLSHTCPAEYRRRYDGKNQ